MVGDMISVIDMPPPEESIWWRGKRGFDVGFFPCECVEVIGDKVPHGLNCLPGQHGGSATLPHFVRRNSATSDSPSEPNKPVLRKHGKLITFFRSFILSRPTRGKLKKRGILRERVFGCDLGEHLLNTGSVVPSVLSHCSAFIECRGIVDGIYRLSGISSNIQRLRVAFDEDRLPDLFNDRLVVQDIHSVSSLLKMYFRELPNPVCTFHLYEKFVEAARSSDDVRLPKLKDVVSQLPPPNYRTLEYLIKHLHRISLKHGDTGMTAKNVAIVWAPNLLRCKSLETGGVAALQGVGVQAVVTEYLIKYCELIFSEKLPSFSTFVQANQDMVTGTPVRRPKSLAISTPTKLLSLEEARNRALIGSSYIENQKYIEVGGGPENLPSKYHTVLELPGGKKVGGSFKQKKLSTGASSGAWKSIFSGTRDKKKLSECYSTGKTITSSSETNSSSFQQIEIASSDSPNSAKQILRPVRSAESLIPANLMPEGKNGRLKNTAVASPLTPSSGHSETDGLGLLETVTSALSDHRKDSPKCHSRSSSHDSYFERQNSVKFSLGDDDDESNTGIKQIDSSLDISEIQVNFDLEDNEMKIFSEDEAMMSTSVGSELSLTRSPLETEPIISKITLPTPEMPASPIILRCTSRQNDLIGSLNSPSKSRRMSFKEKLKKFTSPTLSRKQQSVNTPTDKGVNKVVESKMIDSGVGIDSDSCYSGSYEVTSPCEKKFENNEDKQIQIIENEVSKYKDKLVTVNSPDVFIQSNTGSDCNIRQKTSIIFSEDTTRNNVKKQETSLLNRSIDEVGPVDVTSNINMSPSIRFIDASSSYELISDLEKESSICPAVEIHDMSEMQDKPSHSDNAEVVDVMVHSDPQLSRDPTVTSFSDLPISIIGGLFPLTDYADTVSQTETIISSPVVENMKFFNNEYGNSDPQLKTSSDEELQSSSPLTEESPTRNSDSISLSLAGATVSENESFGLDSFNDEEFVDCEPETNWSNKTSKQGTEYYNVEKSSMESLEHRIEPCASPLMESSISDTENNINNIKQGNAIKVDPEDNYPVETDMTIVSAELHLHGGIINENIHYTQVEDTLGDFYTCISTEAPILQSRHKDESIERKSQEDIQLLEASSLSSSILESDTKESLVEILNPPNIISFIEPEGCSSDQLITSDSNSLIKNDNKEDLDLHLLSPQSDTVVMRKSPSSPARNRSVRSDFVANLSKDPEANIHFPLKLDVAGTNRHDIGLPPLPKSSQSKPVTAMVKALSPQPYNKPSLLPKQNDIYNINENNEHIITQNTDEKNIIHNEIISLSTEKLLAAVENLDYPSQKLPVFVRAVSVEPQPTIIYNNPLHRAVSLEPHHQSYLSERKYSETTSELRTDFDKQLPSAMNSSPNVNLLSYSNHNKSSLASFDDHAVPESSDKCNKSSEPILVETVRNVAQAEPQMKPIDQPKEGKEERLNEQNEIPYLYPISIVTVTQRIHDPPGLYFDSTKTESILEQGSQDLIESANNGTSVVMEDAGDLNSEVKTLTRIDETIRETKVLEFQEDDKKIKFNPSDIIETSTPMQSRTKRRRGKDSKNKSSTVSLHTIAIGSDHLGDTECDSPPLQRRNSIHNVPYVDVNDPETRTRMERYKQERRSTLRAKYKAEDYFTEGYVRKKKLSSTSTSSHSDSTECFSDTQQYTSGKLFKSSTPPSSPEIKEETVSQPLLKRDYIESNQDINLGIIEESKKQQLRQTFSVRSSLESSPEIREISSKQTLKQTESLRSSQESFKTESVRKFQSFKSSTIAEAVSISHKLVDLRMPQPATFISRKSLPDNLVMNSNVKVMDHTVEKSYIASNETNTNIRLSRPFDLTLSKTSNVQTVKAQNNEINMNNTSKADLVNTMKDKKNISNSVGDQIDDNVNVKDLARVFGPQKIGESKVRTVNTSQIKEKVKRDGFNEITQKGFALASNPKSPSKIKNIAAIFEQKH